MSKQAAALKTNAVTGIIVSYLNRAQMEAAAKAAVITLAGDDEKASVNLYAHYLKEVGGDSRKLLECQDCHGRSPEALEACPYCKGEPASTDSKAAEGAKADPPKKGKKEATMEKAAAGGSKQTGLVLAEGTSIAKHSEKELDQAVKKVFELKVQSAMSMWQLGREIAHIRDEQLWKLRNGEDGKPKYKTAEAFVTAELNMSVIHAWNLAKVSLEYEEKAVTKFGPSKLGLVLQAPPEARPAIQAQVESGASKSKIAKAVRTANKGRQTVTDSTTGKTIKNPQASKDAKAADGGRKTITVANIEGSQTLKMYRKETVKGEDKKAWTPAKRVGDVPFCTMELENDIVQEFTLLDAGDGTLKLKIVTKRI